MLPQPLFAPAITYIFAKMTAIHNCQVGVWQRKFLSELFRVLFAMRGRVNFTNLARYSIYIEQTFRRHFQKAFDWVAFNLTVLRLRRHPSEPLIGAFDCSYLPKSGTETWGLAHFFSSTAGKSKKGLEVSMLGAIATRSREPIGLDATQTPPISSGKTSGYTRVDFYCEQLLDLAPRLREAGFPIDHWVGDGYYAKQKVFEAVDRVGAHLVTRLRSDANLRYLSSCSGEADEKIDWGAPEQLRRRFEEVGRLADKSEIRVLTAKAYSPHFDQILRIVLLATEDFSDYVVLCSTDTAQPAEQVAEYYRLRYQLEFVIRDAKQHTGLTHCQARSEEKIDFHLNMSVAGVGLLRLLAQKKGCSLHTYRREAYNRMLIGRLFSKLGLSAEFDRSDPRIQKSSRSGVWPSEGDHLSFKPARTIAVGNFRRIRADTPSEPISRIQVEDSRFSLSHPSRMSNALRSGLPGQVHLKRGRSATCLKISSMLSRPAVPTVTLRIVHPAVRTSFPAMSITSRRSLFAWVCTGGERNSRFRGLSVFAGLEPVLLERLVESLNAS